jgi:hypothetical protein
VPIATANIRSLTMTGTERVRALRGRRRRGPRRLSVEVHEDDLRQITVSLVCGDQHSPNPLLFLSGARRPLVLVAGRTPLADSPRPMRAIPAEYCPEGY